MERNTIIKGDCIEVMKDIPSRSVDLILTDMPYGTLNKSNPEAKWDKEVSLPS